MINPVAMTNRGVTFVARFTSLIIILLACDWLPTRLSNAHYTRCSSTLVDDLLNTCYHSYRSVPDDDDVIAALHRATMRDVTTAIASPERAGVAELKGEDRKSSNGKIRIGSGKMDSDHVTPRTQINKNNPASENKQEKEKGEEEEEELRNAVQLLRQLLDKSHRVRANDLQSDTASRRLGSVHERLGNNQVMGEHFRQQQQKGGQLDDLRELDQLGKLLASGESFNNQRESINSLKRLGQKPSQDSDGQRRPENENLALAQDTFDSRYDSVFSKRDQNFEQYTYHDLYPYPDSQRYDVNNEKSHLNKLKSYLYGLKPSEDDSNPPPHEEVNSLNEYLAGLRYRNPSALKDDEPEDKTVPRRGAFRQTWPLERQKFSISERFRYPENAVYKASGSVAQKLAYQEALKNYLQKLMEDIEAERANGTPFRDEEAGTERVGSFRGRSKRMVARVNDLYNTCCTPQGCSTQQLQNFCAGLSLL
jgi:hypothetical protein